MSAHFQVRENQDNSPNLPVDFPINLYLSRLSLPGIFKVSFHHGTIFLFGGGPIPDRFPCSQQSGFHFRGEMGLGFNVSPCNADWGDWLAQPGLAMGGFPWAPG